MSTETIPDLRSLTTLNADTAQDYEDQMRDLVRTIAERFRLQEHPATDTDPNALARRLDAIDLDGSVLNSEELRAELDDLIMGELVWFHHPNYLAHLNCPVDLNAVAAESVLAAVNPSVDTYDQSRIGTLVERKVLRWVAERLGFGGGDGIFTSGGTQSNLHALFLAREATLAGLHGEERWQKQGSLTLVTSSESHFSVKKSALLLGLAPDSVVTITADANGRMNPQELDETLRRVREEGRHPMAVSATAGTTDRGVIDPLNELAEVCATHDVWFHVDAAYGGGLLTSSRHRHLLRGISRADSVTIDFHKTFFQPVSSSAVFLKDLENFRLGSWHAEYLNPEDTHEPNQVDKSLQTTRRFDALKLWATLRGTGVAALGEAIDTLLETTQRVHAELPSIPGMELLSGTDLTTVMFRWQPEGVSDAQADALVGRLRDELHRAGQVLVARTVLKGRPCLKITILNPETRPKQILAALHHIAATAQELHTGRRPATSWGTLATACNPAVHTPENHTHDEGVLL